MLYTLIALALLALILWAVFRAVWIGGLAGLVILVLILWLIFGAS